MVDHEVTISTSFLDDAGTSDNVFIKLLGFDGSSEHTKLIGLEGDSPFARGAIKLKKQPLKEFPEDSKWFPTKVVVKSPEGETYKFPIYKWIDDSEVYCFTEERVHIEYTKLSGTFHFWPFSTNDAYSWEVYGEGIPHHLKVDSYLSLPLWEPRRDLQFAINLAETVASLGVKLLSDSKESWTDIDEIKGVFWGEYPDISDYVQKHWKEDAFFGYQYLNGVNPMLIRRCSALPRNFPVTDKAVSLSLTDEMKEGNIFLCDYKSLDGLTPNTIHGKEQYLMAPLVLLHKTPDDRLMPIAIQLKQTPAGDNPIFYPTDSEYDWLMAKIFVRGADFHEHELNVHLLRTHLLAEVFTVSLLRNLSEEHPLHELLVHHTRYTLQINYLARGRLISEEGILDQIAAAGGNGMKEFLERSTASLTYSSLCIPEDIAERGLEDVPNFYYRDDGRQLWDIIHRFVKGMLSFYYRTDTMVQSDPLVQRWILDIFEHGFLSNAGTRIPQSFTTVDELVKFVTMVIFTCSAQHSAVNSGQFDYGGWMPNAPTTLRRAPPTTKGTTNEDKMLKTLPDQGTTAEGMAAMWLLSRPSKYANGTLKITDRKKHIFKLAQGEYIAPEKIETVYSLSDPVAQIFVHGESLQACLVGIVVPDPDFLPIWLKKKGIEGSYSELCSNQDVKNAILEDLLRLGKEAGLKSFEQVRDIGLHPEMFSIQNGLLTPTLKAKRAELRSRFREHIDELYAKIKM